MGGHFLVNRRHAFADGRARRCEDEPPGAAVPRRFEHVQRACDIGFAIEAGILDGRPDAGTGGKVDDRFGAFRHPQAERGIADVALDQFHAAGGEHVGDFAGVARRRFAVARYFRQVCAGADREVVENPDRVAAFRHQFADKAGADKPASARNQPAHQAAFQFTRGITFRVSIRLL